MLALCRAGQRTSRCESRCPQNTPGSPKANGEIMATNKLSHTKVAALLKAGAAGIYGDGDRLWLEITKRGFAFWLFRYRWASIAKSISIGPARIVPLKAARDTAGEYRLMLEQGRDPKGERQKAKASQAETFRVVAEKFYQQSTKALRNWETNIERA